PGPDVPASRVQGRAGSHQGAAPARFPGFARSRTGPGDHASQRAVKLGIFGGTFDPVHIGHLIVAQDAWAALGLDQVVFVPAAVPPHKRGRVRATPEQRLEMLRAATAGDPRFTTSDIELRRAGPSYTVDTLRELRER